MKVFVRAAGGGKELDPCTLDDAGTPFGGRLSTAGGSGGGAVLREMGGDVRPRVAAASVSSANSRASILSSWIVALGSTRFSKSLTRLVVARMGAWGRYS